MLKLIEVAKPLSFTTETSPNRKLGHYTILGKNQEAVEKKLMKVKKILTIKSA